jgi:hypothetical protein
MKRKILSPDDKSFFEIDPKTANKPQASFLMDEIAKSAEGALADAREASWGYWLNSEPLIMGHVDDSGKAYMFFISEAIQNRVVLLYFWDSTLLPCRRDLRYILKWNKRYHSAGLITIGVHSPYFSFSKDKKNLLDFTREQGITFPVVQDANYELWRAFENKAWPRKILLSPGGKVKLDFTGEGDYQNFEKNIQILLRELSPGLASPPVLRPFKKIDTPDFSIPHVTEEIFFGKKNNPRLGNAQVFKELFEEVKFTDNSQGVYAEDLVYLDGTWHLGQESIFGTPYKEDLSLNLKFSGTDVYLVASAKAKNPIDLAQLAKISILIDGKQLIEENIGGDAIINEFRKSVVLVRDPKCYHVAKNLESKNHTITIKCDNDGSDTVEIYALFFEHMA